MTHRILVACGTGAATSTHVATILREKLSDLGLDVTTTQCRVQDVESSLHGVDIVVSTSSLESAINVPAFSGVPFLTGVGSDTILESIVKVLKDKEKI